MSQQILRIVPSNITIKNFSNEKFYKPKVTLYNLSPFPLMLSLRSSDISKMTLNEKGVKLGVNQAKTLTLNIKDNINYVYSRLPIQKRVYLIIKNDLFEDKFSIDLLYAPTAHKTISIINLEEEYSKYGSSQEFGQNFPIRDFEKRKSFKEAPCDKEFQITRENEGFIPQKSYENLLDNHKENLISKETEANALENPKQKEEFAEEQAQTEEKKKLPIEIDDKATIGFEILGNESEKKELEKKNEELEAFANGIVDKIKEMEELLEKYENKIKLMSKYDKLMVEYQESFFNLGKIQEEDKEILKNPYEEEMEKIRIRDQLLMKENKALKERIAILEGALQKEVNKEGE